MQRKPFSLRHRLEHNREKRKSTRKAEKVKKQAVQEEFIL